MEQQDKKKKIKKGDYGYLQKNKLIQLIISLVLMIMVLVIFYTGYVKYGNNKNTFTVFAVVSVIPAAKFMVTYIVMMPYKSLSLEKFESINSFQNVKLLYDLLITSTEKVIHINIAAIRDNSVYLLVENEKYEKNYVEKYIRSFLEKECKVTAVRMFRNMKEYKKAVSALEQNEAGKYDKRICELMTIFSM
ncbi:MAG: hypothetical protein IJA27_05655 [Lachnospiraceae bacterium]|nr:hypothetical protein [Lachnospiraceae bacterium]